MKKKVIIKHEHFHKSSGYNKRDECPLYFALKDELGTDISVWNLTVDNNMYYPLYIIPSEEWNYDIVQPIVDRAHNGETVPDFELELELTNHSPENQ